MENVDFYENKIIERLNSLAPHDRFLSCDSFGYLCEEIGKEYNRNISVFDCMNLWGKFQKKEWDNSEWKDADGDCSCDRCQDYKKEKINKMKEWLLKYPDTLDKDVYVKRCKEYGLIPIER